MSRETTYLFCRALIVFLTFPPRRDEKLKGYAFCIYSTKMTTNQEKLTELQSALSNLILDNLQFKTRKEDIECQIVELEQKILNDQGLVNEQLQAAIKRDLEKIVKLIQTEGYGPYYSIELIHEKLNYKEWIIKMEASFHSSLNSNDCGNDPKISYTFTIHTEHPHVESIVRKFLNETLCKDEAYDTHYEGCPCCPGSQRVRIPKNKWNGWWSSRS